MGACRTKRQPIEQVLFKRSPAHKSQSPVCFQTAPNVAEGCNRIIEKHHAEARERRIEHRRIEGKDLCIGMNEPNSPAAFDRAPGKRQNCG